MTPIPGDHSSDDWFELAMQAREQIRLARSNRPTPDIDEIIREMREERDQQILRNMWPDLFGYPD
jgi:hypothetical protein